MAPSKRPLGLGKAAKLKRAKKETEGDSEATLPTDPVPSGNSAIPDADPDVEIEVAEPSSDKEATDEELAEALGLFAKLRQERSSQLARGLVHECDQLLRNRHKLPLRLYVGYGAALLTLAELEDTGKDSPVEFRTAGLERIDEGLEEIKGGEWHDVKAVAAQELLHHADYLANVKGVSEEVDAIHELVERALKLVESATSYLNNQSAELELASTAVAFMELEESLVGTAKLADLLTRFEDVIHAQCEVLKNSEHNKSTRDVAFKALGMWHLAKAAPHLDELENDPEAVDQLKSALKCFDSALNEADPDLYVLYAETLLPYADTLSESEQKETYRRAVKHLRKAQLLGVGGLHDVIESLQ